MACRYDIELIVLLYMISEDRWIIYFTFVTVTGQMKELNVVAQ
jgi:hypothetical protein